MACCSTPPVVRRAARAAALCLSVAWFAISPAAHAAGELTLVEAVRLAIDRAPQLEASRAGLEAASQELRRAGTLPDPVLTLGIDNLPVTGADAFDANADFMTAKKFGLRQTVPARAKRTAQRTLAVHEEQVAREEVQAERLNVGRAAGSAWVGLWAAQHERDALGALRTQALLAAQMARARAAGGGSAVDVLAAEAAVLALDGELAAVDGAEAQATAELQRWIGDDAATITRDTPAFDVAPLPEAQALAALDRLPVLRVAGAQVEVAEAALDAARAERRPDWSVAASYGQRSRDLSDMLMLEVGVSLPLFSRSRQGPGIAARSAEHRAALATREDLRRAQIAQVRAAYARWESLTRRLSVHERQLRLAHDRSVAALAA